MWHIRQVESLQNMTCARQVNDRAFIFFHVFSCRKTIFCSKSSVKFKIKYQGHFFEKNDHYRGISVSQTLLVFTITILIKETVSLGREGRKEGKRKGREGRNERETGRERCKEGRTAGREEIKEGIVNILE